MERKEYAEHLDISRDYLAFVETCAERPLQEKSKTSNSGSGTHNPKRLQQLCQQLSEERQRLFHKNEHKRLQPPPAEAIRTAEDAAPKYPPSVDPLEQRFQDIERRLAELEHMASQSRPEDASTATTITQPPSRSYRSPFSPERWQEHDARVDDARVQLVQTLIIQLCEELGHMAQIRDPQRRGEIRAQLSDALMLELFGAIEGFEQEFPGTAVIKLIESWRSFLKTMSGNTASSISRKE
mgnify:FL=1